MSSIVEDLDSKVFALDISDRVGDLERAKGLLGNGRTGTGMRNVSVCLADDDAFSGSNVEDD